MQPSGNRVIEIVWFKRDLRVYDHEALVLACERAKQSKTAVLALYVIEPQIWLAADASWRQWQFVEDCLAELQTDLNALEIPFLKAFGEMPNVLAFLADQFLIANLWSHQETGNAMTFRRDLAVKAFCKKRAILWHEPPQQPIQRAGINRDHYHPFSQAFFEQPQALPPLLEQGVRERNRFLAQGCGADFSEQLARIAPMEQRVFWQTLQSRAYPQEQTQRGGRSKGLLCLHKILKRNAKNYLATLAKPQEGAISSSRLSPHLAWGSLSIREVIAAVLQQLDALKNRPAGEKSTMDAKRELRALLSRLFWQSHFMQKLESEAAMEFQALHPMYENLRPWNVFTQQKLWAWQSGNTGMPMVDACMRCLAHTGWLPFRMRAMVVSFASYQLWIPWQQFAPFLGALFTDYEPGIHYSQIQMQSGTTGINQMRVYNPVKQAQDHDKQGRFIAQWLPALARVPLEFRFEPWKMGLEEQQQYGCVLGQDYPFPVVEHEQAARFAKAQLAQVRKQNGAKELSKAVFVKHGSRLSKEQRQWTRRSARSNAKKSAEKTAEKNSPAGKKSRSKHSIPESQMRLFD